MVERIRHWVVAMFENRSFDSLLGHLPHIGAADGIRDREIALPYPGGSVRVRPTQKFTDPDPDPGEAWPNVNVQMYGHHRPESNAGKAAYSIMPNFMSEPYNQPDKPAVPTMDGFATDYFANFVWWVGRKPTDTEMQAIGGVFTPQTAPVLNTLASEYAVFTRWFCEAPTCTFPNRSFYHTGTSLGRIDNEAIVNFAWQNDTPNLFDLLTDKGIAWKAYFDRATQIVPDCAINLSGLHHVRMWHQHVADWSDFYADAAAGALPAYSWIEPNLLFGRSATITRRLTSGRANAGSRRSTTRSSGHPSGSPPHSSCSSTNTAGAMTMCPRRPRLSPTTHRASWGSPSTVSVSGSQPS